VFALGITIYELLEKKQALPGTSAIAFAEKKEELDLDFKNERYKPFIMLMVLHDLTKRPTAAQALEIFNKIN
jgi:hypothetical protein